MALKFAELVYNGQWYTPLREALSAFVDTTQETVTGDVKLKLYKGNIITAGVTSPYTLYSEDIATFGEDRRATIRRIPQDSSTCSDCRIKVRALNDAGPGQEDRQSISRLLEKKNNRRAARPL